MTIRIILPFYWIAATLILMLSECNDSSQSRVVLNHEFSFTLPFIYEANSELLDVVHEVNSDVIGFYLLDLKDIPNTTMTVSCYIASVPMTLHDAFLKETVPAKPDNLGSLSNDYKLISFDHYTKSGKSLYLKVSSPMSGICNVMYYFMKNNYDKSMYEIKVAGNEADQAILKNLAEKLAMTVVLL